jgi:hypothetical protein
MNKVHTRIVVIIVLVSLVAVLIIALGPGKTHRSKGGSEITSPQNGKADIPKQRGPQMATGKKTLDGDMDKFLEGQMRDAVQIVHQKESDDEIKKTLARSDSYQQLLDRTKENLKKRGEPQVIHGTITLDDINKMDGKKPIITATSEEHGIVSKSAIIDGDYSLGVMPPGKYDFFLEETKEIPGGMYHNIEVKPGQPAQKLDFKYNESSIIIKLTDENGQSYISQEAKLTFGGTDMKYFHNFKTISGIENGVWRVNHINNGPYYVKVEGSDFEPISGHITIKDGENSLSIKMKEGRKSYVFGLENIPELSGKQIHAD